MDTDLTLGEYLDEWLDRQQTQLQPSTWESYRGVVTRHLLPNLGDVPLVALTRRQVETLYSRLFTGGGLGGKPLAKRSVGYVHSIVHKALEDAVKDDLLARNVSHGAALPKVDHTSTGDTGPKMHTWDAAELRRFLADIDEHPLAELFLVAAFTGLRRGELCGLRWEDVDLDRGLLQVRRALTVIRGHVRLKAPKSSRARALHIDASTIEALRRRAAIQTEQRQRNGPLWHNEHDLVFTGSAGRHLGPDTVSTTFRKVVAGLDLPLIRFHDLRHTHATLMLQAGVPVKVVSERLGHATAQLTMDIYAHVLPAMDADAIVRFAEHVLGAETPV